MQGALILEPALVDGKVVAIQIAAEAGGAVGTRSDAELRAGQGIPGDRHFRTEGQSPEQEITLIEVEEIERFNAETGLTLRTTDTRRNIVTRGIRLNGLIGVELTVGDAVVEGIELCEPCRHLAKMLIRDHSIESLSDGDIITGLTHRAGLRASIVRGGVIRVGDKVCVTSDVSPE